MTAAAKKVDLTRPVKSQPADDAAVKAAAEAAAKAAAEEAALVAAVEAEKVAAEQAASEAAAAAVAEEKAAAEAAAQVAAKAALTDTILVKAISTVGLAGAKMKVPGDEFELPSGTAIELEALGIVAFLEDVEVEEALAARKAARKAI